MHVSTKPQAVVRWIHDVFSNTMTVFEFDKAADQLEISCVFDIMRTSFRDFDFPIADHARRYPFNLENDQKIDLSACQKPIYNDDDGQILKLGNDFVRKAKGDTWALLTSITRGIKEEFEYQRRETPGIQAPVQTLQLGSGTCRDFSALMCEIVRRLGFAARFVTGYLYDPALDLKQGRNEDNIRGAGATHAWIQVFLPGAGWIEFDPTNGDVASSGLIRTGVGRVPSQVVPLAGSYFGAAQDAVGLNVDVDIRMLAPTIAA